jgi:sarcosine oxidase
MSTHYDVAVIGLGGWGSAVLAEAAARGLRAIGIERHAVGHGLGSSGSPSRGFRKAYFSHPGYVALAHRAERSWRALEEQTSEVLYDRCGALFVGAPDHPGVRGVAQSSRIHGLPHELLDAATLRERYPVLVPAEGDVAVLEHDAGVLHADRGNRAHVARARALGAEVRDREAMVALAPRADAVTLETERATITARRVVLTAGAWLGELLRLLPPEVASWIPPLRLERQVELWFSPLAPLPRPEHDASFGSAELPLFHFGLRDGRSYYGVPRLGGGPIKAVRHHGGATVSLESLGSVATAEDEADVRSFLREFIPGANGALHSAKVCLNVNTPDMHPLLGVHPAEPRLLVAGGCSGHGYKFAPVIGELVVDLLTVGSTSMPVSFLAPGRFGAK